MTETNDIIFLNFADNKLPEFKEVKSKEWILFGEDNKFPDHLLYLYNKSSNHNAIVNGKATYIIGKGFAGNPVVNRKNQKFNFEFKKFVIDVELFGGGYFEVIWKMGGGMEISHTPFNLWRKHKDGTGFWYKKDWKSYKQDPLFVPNFDDTNKTGRQIFSYNEYRPGCDHYPLPGYFGSLNDIETDVEISKYNLSVIKNGMFSSKMIVFGNGVPTAETKRDIEKDFKKKFAGSDNAGNFMLVFSKQGEAPPQVLDLSTTDLDKLFDQLNKTTQAEIFSGHQVTSPMLFGIMEPGKLGGRNELQDAYEIFKNTYINDKQQAIEEVAMVFAPYFSLQNLKLEPVEPISNSLNPVDFKELLPKSWVFEKLGISEDEYPEDISMTPTGPVNENVKNLTGRQHQQVLRIIRQVSQGKLKREQAVTLLKTSLALGDEEINSLLQTFSMSEDKVAMMFEEIGEPKSDFTIVKSLHFDRENGRNIFADLSQVDSDILDMIKKDKRITPEIISEAIGSNKDYIQKRIEELKRSGVITQSVKSLGVDRIIETSINPEMIDSRPKPETLAVYVKYSYEVKPGEGPEIISTTRPFCKKLIELDRLYTRSEIERISERLGYSVFDRKGGWWGDSFECRHEWRRNLVIKKNK